MKVREAAQRIADDYPWVHDGGDNADIFCFHCNRDWYLPDRSPLLIDRRAHEPDCSWMALRDALGMKDPH